MVCFKFSFFCNDGSGSDCVCMWKDKSMMINVYLFVCLFVRFQLDQLRMNKKCSMYQNKLQNKQTEKKQSSFWLSKRKKNVMKFQPFFSGVIFNHNFSTTILLDKQTIRIDRLSNCFWLINFTHTHTNTHLHKIMMYKTYNSIELNTHTHRDTHAYNSRKSFPVDCQF